MPIEESRIFDILVKHSYRSNKRKVMHIVYVWLLIEIFHQVRQIGSFQFSSDTQTKSTSINNIAPTKVLSPFHELVPDAFVDPPEFIRSRKFLAEVHHVLTQDNYVLTLHRIVNPLVPVHLRNKLKPVLLQHGLFTSSYNYIIASDRNNDRPRFDARDLVRTWPLNVYSPQAPFSWHKLLSAFNDLNWNKLHLTQTTDRWDAPVVSDAMGFEMANRGYDVWMGNSRGSTYSLNHTKYDWRYDWRYWDFSFHEMGLYDAPAQIDYILSLRKKKSLAYIGHSQGNLAMFILQSFKPEWRHKVKPFIALSPIALLPDVYYGTVRVLIKLIESTLITTTQLNRILKGQIFPKNSATGRALDLICVPKWTTPICTLATTLITGNNLFRANSSLIPIIWNHIPEGTSILNMLHFGQLIAKSEFCAFDFGSRENLRRYGQQKPPSYPIHNIKSPDIAFVVGRTDPLSTPINVELTRSKLTVPLLDYYIAPDPFWGHADHTYASGSGKIITAHVMGLVDRYRLVDM